MISSQDPNPEDGRISASDAVLWKDELAVAGEDGVTRFWTLGTWNFRREIKAQKKGINALATNGTFFFTGSRDHTIIVWEMEKWTPIYRFKGFCAPIASLHCNSSYLAYITGIFGTTGIVDLSTLQKISHIWSSEDQIGNIIDCDLDDEYLVTASDEGEICAWRLHDQSLAWRTTIDEPFPHICTNDGVIACGGCVGGIQIFKLGRETPLKMIPLPSSQVYSITLSGPRLAIGQENGTTTVWDFQTQRQLHSPEECDDPVTDVLLTGDWAIALFLSGRIQVYSLQDFTIVKEILNKTPAAGIDAPTQNYDAILKAHEEKIREQDALIKNLQEELKKRAGPS